MAKITFMGAGSRIFATKVLGDCMLSQPLQHAHIALYDIDATRLHESKQTLETLNKNINQGRAKITAHCGVENRRDALRGANYVINAILVGGFDPTVIKDFEIPQKYGLRQTIGDTVGIGGIFRAQRTIPVLLEFASDMMAVCPDAWLLNYTNPMVSLTTAVIRATGIRTVGLCHSVQVCAKELLEAVGMTNEVKRLKQRIAGINHQAWLLEITDNGKDLYPEIKRRAKEIVEQGRKDPKKRHVEMVRLEIMRNVGYFVTESPFHQAEYCPWFIKAKHPELVEEFGFRLDELQRHYAIDPTTGRRGMAELVDNQKITHERSLEYASYIIEAMETDVPNRIAGNIMNNGLITNLPRNACVEVPCLVDRNGVQGCYFGDLPEQCAAINRTNINVHLLAVEAALTRKKDYLYQAAMLDPHTAAELTIDEIRNLCDDLIEAHGGYLPKYN